MLLTIFNPLNILSLRMRLIHSIVGTGLALSWRPLLPSRGRPRNKEGVR
jgi:hypothetical protein